MPALFRAGNSRKNGRRQKHAAISRNCARNSRWRKTLKVISTGSRKQVGLQCSNAAVSHASSRPFFKKVKSNQCLLISCILYYVMCKAGSA